jgi:hypothetical protein
MKNIIAIIIAIVFSICCAYAQDCLPKLIKVKTDTTFTLTDSNLMLVERQTNDTYQVLVTFKKVEPVVTTVEDSQLTYVGAWVKASGATYSVTYSSEVGATARYSFTGNRVQVFCDKASNHGDIGIRINNGIEKTYSLYSPTRMNSQLIFDEPVPPGYNTITLRCVSNTVLIDKLLITN